jgi:alcohol dehydrogenase, propanol-preferring
VEDVQTSSGPAVAWPPALRAHATINFAPTAATWPLMQAATRPLGRIVAAAMVSDAVPLSQEWLTWTGITLTGTSVGSRADMAALMAMQREAPFRTEIERIGLSGVTDALAALEAGHARGRICVVF